METNSNIERFRLRPARLREAPEHQCDWCPIAFYTDLALRDHEAYRHHDIAVCRDELRQLAAVR